MADEDVDEEFNLIGRDILLPYVRDQGAMNVCYAYSTTEAIAALYVQEVGPPALELSIQQIADYVPRVFGYKNRRNRRDRVGCYFGSHIHALEYAMNVGLCREIDYPRRGSRWGKDIPAVPDTVKYKISHFERVYTEDSNESLRRDNENPITEERFNEILEKQPIIAAIRIYRSFLKFRGEGVYMGWTGDDDEDYNAGHSVLIIGRGVRNGVKTYRIKNSHGTEWGDQGYGDIERSLLYRLAYPVTVYKDSYEPPDSEVGKKPSKYAPSGSGTKRKRGR